MPNTLANSKRTVRLSFYLVIKLAVSLCLIFAILIHPLTAGLGGRPTLFHLMIGLSLTLVFLRIMSTKKTRFMITSIDRVFLLILLSISFSYIFNLSYINEINFGLQNISGTTGTMWKVILLGLISITVSYSGYRLAILSIHSRRDVSQILFTIVLSTTINAIVNIISWFYTTGGSLTRYGFIPPLTISPGLSASLSVLGFVLSLSLLKDTRMNYKVKMVIYATLFIQCISILILTVRQSYVMFAISILIYTILASGLTRLPIKRLLSLLISLAFIGLVFIFIFKNANDSLLMVMSGTFNSSGDDMTSRFVALNSAWELFKREPLFGVGYGLFGARNDVPMLVLGNEQIFVSSAHNGFANVLSEMGITGLISFLFTGYVVTRYNWRVRKEIKDPFYHGVSSAILTLILVEMINQFISNSVLLPPPTDSSTVQLTFVYWTLIGMLVFLRNGLTCMDNQTPLSEETGHKVGKDFFLAFSPERVYPDNK